MTFEVRKGNTTVRSVCTNSVRNAFRKQAGWAKLQEARAAAAIGHIQSAGCLGQKEVVTATHNACIRELLQEVDVHGKADRHMKLLTIETKRRLGTLWDQEQCTQFCSRDELWEAAKEEEMKIPWKAANEESPIPEEQYQERFWRRRLDGIGLDMVNKEFLAIEFKRTRDARSNYVERALAAVAQEQYKSSTLSRAVLFGRWVTRTWARKCSIYSARRYNVLTQAGAAVMTSCLTHACGETSVFSLKARRWLQETHTLSRNH